MKNLKLMFITIIICVVIIFLNYNISFCANSSSKKYPNCYEIVGKVENVSQPINPNEVIMTLSLNESEEIELILSKATRYYPNDYYPCAGDKVKVSYVVLGIFKKYVIAYSVRLIEEFSGINRTTFKVIKKVENK